MIRTRQRLPRIYTLLALPLLAAGALWLVLPVAARSTTQSVVAPRAPRGPAAGGARLAELLELQREERTEVCAPTGARAPATEWTPAQAASEVVPPLPIQVRGEVRSGGRPVPDFDLSFQAASGGPAQAGDWDFTDGRGGFEVELLPGTYEVLGGPLGELCSRVVVPARAGALTLDIELAR